MIETLARALRLSLTVSVVALSACTTAPLETAPPSMSADARGVAATLTRIANVRQVCGAVLAVVRGGQLASVDAVGGCGEPPPMDAVFEAASLSKPLFAYAVLQLVRQGRMALDAPVLGYLPADLTWRDPMIGRPDAPAFALHDPALRQITVRMLLQHRSGLPNWAPGPLQLASQPGQGWRYSGMGYVLLQRAVEAVTGQPLERWMAEQVLAPLGMTASSYVSLPDLASRLRPGRNGRGEPQPKRRFTRALSAATLITTAGDYARFLAALARDPAMLALMQSGTAPVEPALGVEGGIGMLVERTARGSYLWQWGNNPGYRAFAIVTPARGDALVLLTDSDNGLALVHPALQAVMPDEHKLLRFRLLQQGIDGWWCEAFGPCR